MTPGLARVAGGGQREHRAVVAARAQAAHELQAVDVGHAHVGDHQGHALAAGAQELVGLERLLGAGRDEGPQFPGGEHALEDLAVGGVVVDDQHGRARELVDAEARADSVAVGHGQAEREVEGAAGTFAALDPDAAAHQLHQLRGDRQPEAGAAVAARHRGVRLLERAEDLVELVLRNADAGIADREVQLRVALAPLEHLDADDDLAGVGELDRVADQVHEHLAEPVGIAHEKVGNFGFDVGGELQSLVLGRDRQPPERVCQVVANAEGPMGELELARLDLGEVEDVVDDVQQVVGGAANELELLALDGIVGALERQLGHTHDAVHRRADLVAHVGEELRLGAGGLLRLPHRLLQRRVLGAQLGGALAHLLFEIAGEPAQVLLAPLDRCQHQVEGVHDAADLVVGVLGHAQREVLLVAHPRGHAFERQQRPDETLGGEHAEHPRHQRADQRGQQRAPPFTGRQLLDLAEVRLEYERAVPPALRAGPAGSGRLDGVDDEQSPVGEVGPRPLRHLPGRHHRPVVTIPAREDLAVGPEQQRLVDAGIDRQACEQGGGGVGVREQQRAAEMAGDHVREVLHARLQVRARALGVTPVGQAADDREGDVDREGQQDRQLGADRQVAQAGPYAPEGEDPGGSPRAGHHRAPRRRGGASASWRRRALIGRPSCSMAASGRGDRRARAGRVSAWGIIGDSFGGPVVWSIRLPDTPGAGVLVSDDQREFVDCIDT